MSWISAFDKAFTTCPLIAILRGLHPDEAVAVGEVLVAAGITILEVPLNSPEPYDSIGKLASALKGRAVVGAGTVFRRTEVDLSLLRRRKLRSLSCRTRRMASCASGNEARIPARDLPDEAG
jgi:2-dehydro-3-deoxyphosphogalactonate aldolase